MSTSMSRSASAASSPPRAEDDDGGVADSGDQLVVVRGQVGVQAGAAEAVEAGGEIGPGQQGGHVRIAVGQHDRGRHGCIIPRSKGLLRCGPRPFTAPTLLALANHKRIAPYSRRYPEGFSHASASRFNG